MLARAISGLNRHSLGLLHIQHWANETTNKLGLFVNIFEESICDLTKPMLGLLKGLQRLNFLVITCYDIFGLIFSSQDLTKKSSLLMEKFILKNRFNLFQQFFGFQTFLVWAIVRFSKFSLITDSSINE